MRYRQGLPIKNQTNTTNKRKRQRLHETDLYWQCNDHDQNVVAHCYGDQHSLTFCNVFFLNYALEFSI